MLERLSGRTHEVLSAVALVQANRREVVLSETNVSFRSLSAEEIEVYWSSGEPADKAGAYAVQGLGAAFVEHIVGSYSGVMGLPLFETARLLRLFGISVI
jgi:septum formation protein